MKKTQTLLTVLILTLLMGGLFTNVATAKASSLQTNRVMHTNIDPPLP